ncbi:MAG: 16S rRNA (uracil(1498)-N(3))-methyltransferase [Ramlibacter sp.]|nr:16S rRNA (uracil(1498)-N(3))-methyltransferase [Ramlibacter sp.]
MPRFHCPTPLSAGHALELPTGPARHVQVLRLQPGAPITLFNGAGGEFEAVIEHMGRSDVRVRIVAHLPLEREAARAVHLAVSMPANERMDWLVEKAAELGAMSIQPLVAERSVLKLNGERAARKRAHWQGIAVAACEQCGRNRVPAIGEVMELARWLALPPAPGVRLMLSLSAQARGLGETAGNGTPAWILSGPEGGLATHEEQAALAQGFLPVSLGARVLRAETAPVAVLAALTLGR